MTNPPTREVIRRFCELYDDGTPDSYGSDRFTALWADDVVVEYGASLQFPQGRRLEGKERMLKELERVGGWMRNRHMLVRELVIGGETGALGWSFWATAAVDMPDTPAGSRIRMDGTDILTVRDGLIIHDKQYAGPIVTSTEEEGV